MSLINCLQAEFITSYSGSTHSQYIWDSKSVSFCTYIKLNPKLFLNLLNSAF